MDVDGYLRNFQLKRQGNKAKSRIFQWLQKLLLLGTVCMQAYLQQEGKIKVERHTSARQCQHGNTDFNDSSTHFIGSISLLRVQAGKGHTEHSE